MRLFLNRYRISVRLVPVTRGCLLELSGEDNVGLLIAPFATSEFSVVGPCVMGYTDSQSIWGFNRIREYFFMEFSCTPETVRQTENGGLALCFPERMVTARIAASFVSVEQAELNFVHELQGVRTDEAEETARHIWERLLGTIEVSQESGREDMFYTCLWRTFLYPRIFYEYGKDGKPIHFNADTQKTESGVFYTDNGFWDTYRTAFPLLTVLCPDRVGEMAEGFLNYADETGWLPKWLSPGEIGLMPGTLSEAMLADACVKGVLNESMMRRAYTAMKKSADIISSDSRFGRKYLGEYLKYGYVPNDCRESVNHTLDCSYGDFCVGQVAKCLGEGQAAQALFVRSRSWMRLYDKNSGFLRGRDSTGAFCDPFDPYIWGGDNCECSSWQNRFSALFDIDGMIALHGGKERFLARLGEIFEQKAVFRVGGYDEEIHEMSEMASVDFGQCAISNQPSFHLPWLFSATGDRARTIYWVRKLADEAFSCSPEGFPGDEDNGSMAAWYIFACLGFYPLCPGKAEYVTARPLFEEIRIRGKKMPEFSDDFISHADLALR